MTICTRCCQLEAELEVAKDLASEAIEARDIGRAALRLMEAELKRLRSPPSVEDGPRPACETCEDVGLVSVTGSAGVPHTIACPVFAPSPSADPEVTK